jgi:tetratricopeptide (TPR) repeat protein
MTDTQADALGRVRLLLDLRRFDEAAALARRTTATEPENVEGWCLLAQALLGLDDDEEALDAAQRAAALAPDYEWPHRLRSIALTSLGRHQKALDAAIECVRCDPFSWRTHARVAGASSAVNLHDQAEAAASRVLELGSTESRAWVIAAGVAAAKGNRDLAAQRYRRALALNPQDADAHAGLARNELKRSNALNPAGLAAAASGLATATRADPRSQAHRRGIDAVLRIFLARTAYGVFLLCFIVLRATSHSSAAAARFIPVVLLALPAAFVARFLANLDRDVRAHLFRTIRRGLIGVAVMCEVVAIGAIVVGAFLPTTTRASTVPVAILGAILARIALIVEFRRKLPDLHTPLVRPVSQWRWLGYLVAASFVGAGALMIYGGLGNGDDLTVIIAGLVAVVIGVAIGIKVGRRR